MASNFQLGLFTGHPMLEPLPYGLGVLKDLMQRWFELDLAHIGSIVAIASAAPTAWAVINQTAGRLYGWFRQLFRASITIPAEDPLNSSVLKWIAAHRSRTYRSFTGRTDVNLRGGGDFGPGMNMVDPAAGLKKTRHPIHYSPHWDTRYLFHNSHLFIITRSPQTSYMPSYPSPSNFHGSLAPPPPTSDITISCLSWSADPIKSLITECRAYADQQTQYFVIIYARDRFGVGGWKPKARKPIRLLDTVHLDDDVKKGLVDDMRTYLDEKTQARYRSRSMPYRRGYLLYGPPGTGKSSLSVALAGEFGLDLYELKIPSVRTDADLEEAFLQVPPKCIVLLEDVDAVWSPRTGGAGTGTSTTMAADPRGMAMAGHGTGGIFVQADGNYGMGMGAENMQTNCTLSGVLNVLDGVASQEGRIVIMTTNRPESLDDALVRPGRVDKKVLLGNITSKSAGDMFMRMFSPDLLAGVNPSEILDMDEVRELASRFAEKVPDDTFTPSHLQGFFQLYLESARDAVANIESWVEKELARKADRGFEFVSSSPPYGERR